MARPLPGDPPRYPVTDAEAGARLDRFLSQHAGMSRAQAMRLIEEGKVRIGTRPGRKGSVLGAGDVVVLAEAPQDPLGTPPVPQPELPLSVLHEDAAVVVVNKPAGAACHPLRPGERGTVASAVVARYPECATTSEPAREGGLCHRLDRSTSGALLFARSRPAWQALRAAFSRGRVEKEYLALVAGSPHAEKGEVDLPLLPAPGHAGRVIVAEHPDQAYRPDAMDARTSFTVVRRGKRYTLLRVRALSGRRHQVRAHLSYLGLPLVGDALYGGGPAPEEILAALSPQEREVAAAPFLHAQSLRFPSPQGPETVTVEAPLPPARQKLLQILLG